MMQGGVMQYSGAGPGEAGWGGAGWGEVWCSVVWCVVVVWCGLVGFGSF